MPSRVIIFVFDGLRPDMVTPSTMPNLHRFGQAGTRFTGSRVAFPSETRVNQASLVTGCWPARHGIAGNRFMDVDAAGGNLINSGDEDQLRAASEALDGKLLDVASLGEILAEQGASLAVAGTGTAGGTRILNHRAETLGQFRLSLYRPDVSTPQEQVQAIESMLGPIPPADMPAIARTTYLLDLFFEHLLPTVDPTVTILWSFEPDISYHYSGLGTDDNLSALRHVDAEFGRLLEWRDGLHTDERPVIVTLSDHGHLAIEGEALDVIGQLKSAGFAVGTSLDDPSVDAAVFCQRAGGIYVREHDRELIERFVSFLAEQPWCELVFATDSDNAIPLEDVGIAHRRAPDVAFVTTSHDGLNDAGFPGRCAHDAPDLATDGGLHGGVHPIELSNWFAVQGPGIATYRETDAPCGIVDVLPTLLSLLGLHVPNGLDGRMLDEVLAGGSLDDHDIEELETTVGTMTLRRRRYRGGHYLERGGRNL